MKTETFAAAQWRYDNAIPPEDNLFALYLESLTLKELLNYGTASNEYESVSDTKEYQAELATRPVPANVHLGLDCAGTYVYDSNQQTEHTVTEYPRWLQHIIHGWTCTTSIRCAERVCDDYRNYLTTGDPKCSN